MRTVQKRICGWVGSLLVACSSTACSDGLVTVRLLTAAGSSGDAEQAGKSGGGPGGESGAAGRGGSGSPSRPPPPCDGEWEIEQEDALLQTLSEAFDTGRYCPRIPLADRRPLAVDPELQFQARGSSCFPVGDRGWFRLGRGPDAVWAWFLGGTPNLEDAKKALLDAERDMMCEQAERDPFRRVGVGHSSDSWSIFIAPSFSEDMQKP